MVVKSSLNLPVLTKRNTRTELEPIKSKGNRSNSVQVSGKNLKGDMSTINISGKEEEIVEVSPYNQIDIDVNRHNLLKHIEIVGNQVNGYKKGKEVQQLFTNNAIIQKSGSLPAFGKRNT